MSWLVIGISGASCSGKTSLASKIHERFENSVLINQDKYFLPRDDFRHTYIPELNHHNWEIISSLDMPQMLLDIQKIMKPNQGQLDKAQKNRKLLIIEGFLIFNYKPIAQLCDKKYFIDISREVCWDRRSKRVYDPPDVAQYFDKIVWPEYVKHKTEIFSNELLYNSLRILDGNTDLNEMYDEVMYDILKFLC